jgi:hypothetical protein
MSHDTNQFKGWLDKEILEYSQLLISQIEDMEFTVGQCETAQASNACIDQIADLKGSLVSCVSQLVCDLDE